jgi:CRP/FNR family cyclic AMP-dependent transcriptional regulator
MELDFTQPAAHDEAYDPEVARKCFESLGQSETVAEMQTFFLEGQSSEKMYLLVEGEVSLLRNKKTLDIVRPGEIFGEMAVITQQPRTATAMARKPCKALSLDAKQFQRAIQGTPEFALMLMNIMNHRLRLTLALMKQTASLPSTAERDEFTVFDKRMMEELVAAFKARPPQNFPATRMIMKEGDAGKNMYVLIKGKVTVSIQGKSIERVGPGGVFGEMALVDQSTRAASATATTDCQLLTITRPDFLDLVKSKPGFAVSLLRAIAERLRHMTLQKK